MITSPTVAPTGADRPFHAIVHREAVHTLDARVLGYTLSVELAITSVPSQRDPGGPPARPAVDPEVVHAAYLSLDLASLVADRYVFLPATPAMLDGYVPAPVFPGRLVLDLPVGYELSPGAVDRAGALRGLGMQLALMDYRGEPHQEALLRHLAYVVVDATRPGLPLAALVHHVHAAGALVLATGVGPGEAQDACRAAGVDGLRQGRCRSAGPS